FDPWLRERAVAAGAELRTGVFRSLERLPDGEVRLVYSDKRAGGAQVSVRARAVIGADGAKSRVASQCIPGGEEVPCVIAYHEIVASPPSTGEGGFDATRCDVWFQGRISPDFYGWVFPHGERTSIGMGTAPGDVSLTECTQRLREAAGLRDAETVRREGAPIPLKPLKRWDDGRNVVLAGDAAGVVAPASGEGIYYAMLGGRLAAGAVAEFLATGKARSLALARKRFMKAHGRVFWVLGLLQRFWYSSDKRRERFVSMCRDPDVQFLTWEAYTKKQLVRARPAAHARIFFKDLAHLFGLVRP
ncbi:MAG: geranylgeranyl diphosphate reductase, partial [Gammaproteobacteria bacterium]